MKKVRFLKDMDGNETMFPVIVSPAMNQEKMRLWKNYGMLEGAYKQRVIGKETLFKMQSQLLEWIEQIKSGYGYSESRVL